eukprot:scaffold30697_cov28-Tisochrysis_lutea.AAC.1
MDAFFLRGARESNRMGCPQPVAEHRHHPVTLPVHAPSLPELGRPRRGGRARASADPPQCLGTHIGGAGCPNILAAAARLLAHQSRTSSLHADRPAPTRRLLATPTARQRGHELQRTSRHARGHAVDIIGVRRAIVIMAASALVRLRFCLREFSLRRLCSLDFLDCGHLAATRFPRVKVADTALEELDTTVGVERKRMVAYAVQKPAIV